ncbi:hypothetical protein [Chromohalobacter moromii]|uniref:Uncharacterized protein n=1 Tax=Chromohalobacter moromii TaxID=2860329 RepID=A0A9X2X0L1_9GAMM|nr:hypothetical protein [Chromohalobacter moromii]MCK2044825.1 hypothetical protein [Chromohalobacter moromii]MCT8504022.1 hypothetical protein [Chromohalobacter moromii]
MEVDAELKLRVIQNAIKSFGEAKHLVWMPLSLVEFLIDNGYVVGYERRVLVEELKGFVSEAKYLKNQFSFYIEIDFENKYQKLSLDGSFCKVGYGHLVDSGQWQPTPLLVEAPHDAKLYELGANCYMISQGFSDSLSAKLTHYPGGGGGTYDMYRDLLDSHKSFLCVLDSDKKHPQGPEGTTAKAFKDVARGVNNNTLLKVLSCSELENVLPTGLVREAIEVHDMHRLEDFEYLVETGFWKFFDFKDGVFKAKAEELDCKHGKYWEEFKEFHDIGEGEKLMRPFSGLARHVLDAISHRSLHQSVVKIRQDVDQEWLHIVEMAASWGACRRREVS